MANKSKMKCNRVVPSDRPGKKKMVKACSGGREKLLHFGAKGYGHNYSAAARKSFAHATSVGRQKTNSHPDIGPAKTFGQAKEEALSPPLNHAEVNTNNYGRFHY